MSSEDMVTREKYQDALDKAHRFKNMWHNEHQKLSGYKETHPVAKFELEELVEEMERYGDRDVDKFAAKLKEMI